MTLSEDSGSLSGTQRDSYRRWTQAEKRRLVEETLAAGASVSIVARRHDVNANQLFGPTAGFLRYGARFFELGGSAWQPVLLFFIAMIYGTMCARKSDDFNGFNVLMDTIDNPDSDII